MKDVRALSLQASANRPARLGKETKNDFSKNGARVRPFILNITRSAQPRGLAGHQGHTISNDMMKGTPRDGSDQKDELPSRTNA